VKRERVTQAYFRRRYIASLLRSRRALERILNSAAEMTELEPTLLSSVQGRPEVLAELDVCLRTIPSNHRAAVIKKHGGNKGKVWLTRSLLNSGGNP
jgi:hypothetical protein